MHTSGPLEPSGLSGTLTLTGTLAELRAFLTKTPKRQWQAFGVVINNKGQIMSTTTSPPAVGSSPILLTNAADPAQATRFIGFLDLVDGTALPTPTVSDPTKLTVVMGTFVQGNPQGTPPTDSGVPFACYPIDTTAETDDSVTVTFTLPENDPIVLTFNISGEPPESDALDPSQSLIGPWANAPNVPATPT